MVTRGAINPGITTFLERALSLFLSDPFPSASKFAMPIPKNFRC
jgi:hypothetical protein